MEFIIASLILCGAAALGYSSLLPENGYWSKDENGIPEPVHGNWYNFAPTSEPKPLETVGAGEYIMLKVSSKVSDKTLEQQLHPYLFICRSYFCEEYTLIAGICKVHQLPTTVFTVVFDTEVTVTKYFESLFLWFVYQGILVNRFYLQPTSGLDETLGKLYRRNRRVEVFDLP